jgi:predicted Zn-dependent protease
MSGPPGLPSGDDLLEVAEAALRSVPAGCEAVVQVTTGSGGLTRFANSRIHQNMVDTRTVIAVLVADGGRAAGSATNRTDAEGVAEAVARAHVAAVQRPPDPDWPGVAGPEQVRPTGHWDEATAAASPGERAEVVAGFVAASRSAQEAAGYCDTSAVVTAVATSAGQRASDRCTQATVDGVFLAPPQGAHTPAGYGHQASVRLADLDAAARGETAARDCESSLGAIDVAPGDYEVVLLPECVAEIVGFLGGYGFNAKAVEDGESFVVLGEAPFDEAFSLADDAYHPLSIGLGVDAEGTARRPLTLVERGRCRSLVHDRRSAAKAGTSPTGHAAEPGSAFGGDAANLVVAGGTVPPAELVGRMERGLVVTCFNYCRVLDPKSVSVTGLTRNGTFLVEGGKVVRAVTNLRFTQSFVAALGAGSVLGVSDGARLADSESGPGRVVAPALHLSSWHFTGGAAG